MVFHVFALTREIDLPEGTLAASGADFVKYAFPRVITRFLEDKTLTLGL